MIEVLDDNNENLFDITTVTHVLHGRHEDVYIDDRGDIKRLNILYMNIQSVLNKLYDIETLIQSLKYTAHIIVLSETWLRENDGKHFNIPGYRSFHSIRVHKRSGGVSIFVDELIEATQLHEEDCDDSNYLVIKLLKHNINVLGIYKGNDTNFPDFSVRLDNILNLYPKSILVGDFNLNLLDIDCNRNVARYVDTIKTNGFSILNKIDLEYSTRITKSSKTIIDHAVSDLNYKFEFNLVEKYLSDHKSIVLSFSVNKKCITPVYRKIVTDYKSISECPIWATLKNETDFDEVNRNLSLMVKSNTKTIVVNARGRKKAWVNTKLLELINKREKYRKMMLKSPSNLYIIEQY